MLPPKHSGEVLLLTAVDHHGHGALIALYAETGEALGLARMIREPVRRDTDQAAVSVADEYGALPPCC